MARLTLYSKLKPEIVEKLEQSTDQYKSVVGLIEKLKSLTFYNELTISELNSLYTFADIEIFKVSSWDFRYGDNLLRENE